MSAENTSHHSSPSPPSSRAHNTSNNHSRNESPPSKQFDSNEEVKINKNDLDSSRDTKKYHSRSRSRSRSPSRISKHHSGEHRHSHSRSRSRSSSKHEHRRRHHYTSRDHKHRHRDRERDGVRERRRRERERERERRDSRRKRSRSSSREEDRRRERKKRRSGWDKEGNGSTDSSRTTALTAEQQAAIMRSQQVAAQQKAAQEAQQQQLAQQAQSFACRIYVGNINYEVGEEEIRAAFSPFGDIQLITMSKDAASGNHKGYCFIEYDSPESAKTALETMSGFTLAGRNIKVGRTNQMPGGMPVSPYAAAPVPGQGSPMSALPYMAQPQTPSYGMLNPQTSRAPSNRIYVGSIHWDLTEKDVRAVFEPFGEIKACNLVPNPETGKHKGYGFIDFANANQAEEAINQMQGFQLGGRQIKVGHAVNNAAQQRPLNPAMMTMGKPAGRRQHESISKEENMTISGSQRYNLMQKLAKGPEKPSHILLLQNMVGVDDVDDELKNEVQEECSKYGNVEDVDINITPSKEVQIYVVFKSTEGASNAMSALDKRWFAGRQISAELYSEESK